MCRMIVLVIVALLASGSFSAPLPAQSVNGPLVFASNYPLEFFARRIAGDHAQILLPVPPGMDPANWIPDESTLLDLQRADLILLNGAGYERWMNTISLPLNRIVDTNATLADRHIRSESVVTHTHGPSGEHSHDNLASTTWLDLQLATEQARQVGRALISLLPQYEAELKSNLDALVVDLGRMDVALKSIGQRFGGRPILASHPVYQYFARGYGFNLQSVHWEPEVEPSLREWQKLDVLLETHPAKFMIWEAPPTAATRADLARRGITPVVTLPLANTPAEGDFLSQMTENLEALAALVPEINSAVE